MIKKITGICRGLPMTITGGVFLAASLFAILSDVKIPVDPAWAAVVICGFPIMCDAVTGLVRERQISSPLLITIAVTASACIGELFAAGEVAFIMAVGAILEEKTVQRAKKGIKKLISLAPEQGRRIAGGKEETVPIEQVKPGDVLRILPGEAVPVDGEIISGNTSVDQSVITGESLPVDKAAGDVVFCGTINRFGAVDIRAVKVGEDSSLQKLIRLVREAEDKKAPMQRVADRWAKRLVPASLAVAVITGLATGDIVRAVTILVVFCPCALVLATPTSIMAAIGQAAKNGVIVKSGEALERMGKVDCVAFDKTGTLTHGNLVVSDVISFSPGLGEDDLFLLAASAEALSEHPLGRAIAVRAKERGLALRPVNDFRMIPGKGVGATADGRNILCGTAAYLSENGVSLCGDATVALDRIRGQGKAAVLVSENGECVGLVALSDTLRESAKSTVSRLQALHTDTVLLTGDHRKTAGYFAGQTGISDVYAELLPAEKARCIQELQSAGRRVCMIGDGVNDAPALKTAYVGVAMGGMGSDIAVEAADIALTGDDISGVPYLKRLSDATVRLIKLNIFLSLAVNFAAVVLSVLALLNPVTGALVHNGGSVLVVLNAALLYERKFDILPV